MVDKELIEIWRNALKPSISLWLLNTNYEEMGEQDKEEFERDFDEILDLALIGLKYKTQLSREGTTSDLISRTETLEHFNRLLGATVPVSDYDEGFVDGVQFAISTISTIPTIQPVATDTNVGDTISRQVAIDAVDSIGHIATMPDGDKCIRRSAVKYTLSMLPSAQPEQRWIPCSETVDIPDHEVMACDRCGEFIIGYLDCKDEQWLCESDDSLMYDPVAWCELPKPYKEGGVDG